MGLQTWFRRRRGPAEAETLLASVIAQSRRPFLYADLGAPDTVEGRFEVAALHLVLLLHRLKDGGPAAAEISQALVDGFTRWLDDGLREMGVGDTVVGKRMRKLASALHGRLRAYDRALAALPERAELEAVIGRTVLGEAAEADPAPLAAYMARSAALLSSQAVETLVGGGIAWSGGDS